MEEIEIEETIDESVDREATLALLEWDDIPNPPEDDSIPLPPRRQTREEIEADAAMLF